MPTQNSYTENLNSVDLPEPANAAPEYKSSQSRNITLEEWNRMQTRLRLLEDFCIAIKHNLTPAITADMEALGNSIGTGSTGSTEPIDLAGLADTYLSIAQAENTYLPKDLAAQLYALRPETGYPAPGTFVYKCINGVVQWVEENASSTDPEPTPVVTYTITTSVAHGTYTGATTITSNSAATATITITPNSGYELPTNVSVSGASYSYNPSTGTISISSPTGNVTITAICTASVSSTYSITTVVTHGTYTGATTIQQNGTATVTISPSTGYELPSSVTVNGATSSYNSTTGVISLSNPTGNVTISAVCEEISIVTYTITTSVTHGTRSGATSIQQGGTATVTISPSTSYELPETVSVTGATAEYNRTTGTITLSNPTGNVTITATCTVTTSNVVGQAVVGSAVVTGPAYFTYTITTTVTHGVYSGSTSIQQSGTATVTITPSEGYLLPDSVSVSGATVNYNNTTGQITLSDPTGNVTVTAVCYAPSLAFASNGDGTCKVVGIGTVTSPVIVIPSISPDGDTVTTVGAWAFYNGFDLTSVTIPNSVTSIEDYAFFYCHNLTSVTLGNSVTYIGSNAFNNCSALTEITIPESVVYLGTGAFSECDALESVEIGTGISTISFSVFNLCTLLEQVIIHATTPPTLSSINAFSNTNNCPIYVPGESVTDYRQAATWSSLANRIHPISGYTITTSVTNGTYSGDISIPAGGTATVIISADSGYTLPSTVSVTGATGSWDPVSHCVYLSEPTGNVTISAVCPQEQVYSTTNVVGEAIVGYAVVTQSSLSTYTITTSITNGTCSGDSSIQQDSTANLTLTAGSDYVRPTNITVTGATFTYNSNTGAIALSNPTGNVTVTATCPERALSFRTDGNSAYVTGIGTYNKAAVVIPATSPDGYTVVGIDDGAFGGTSITSVSIPDSVLTIGRWAFYDCTALVGITLPNSISSIGSNAFTNCNNLSSVSITDIAAWCNISFESPSANPVYHTESIRLNGQLVRDLVIPNSVTIVKPYAFYYCTTLTSVTIGNSVTNIGDGAFCYCTGLTSVTVPDSVTSIGNQAFYGDSALTSITYSGTITSWNTITKGSNWDYGTNYTVTYLIAPTTSNIVGEAIVGYAIVAVTSNIVGEAVVGYATAA